MKKKKIFKTILLVAVILLAVGCGLASCKKTHAYDTIRTNPTSVSAEDYLPGMLLFFTMDVTDGTKMIDNTITIGSSMLSDIFDGTTTIDDYNCYCFNERTTNYTDLIVNFYINPQNRQQRVVEFVLLEEDRIISAYSSTVLIQDCPFMALWYRPLTIYLEYAFVTFSEMTYETTIPEMQIRGNVYTINMTNETYINGYSGFAPLYDINFPSNYVDGQHLGLHSNMIFFQTNLPTFIDLQDLILYVYNEDPTIITPYIYQFSVNGYRGGYAYGYQQGLDAADLDAYDTGYHYGYLKGREDGYDDGASGNNAVSSFINILTSIFTGIGAIFSIELFPHITIGLFLLVPLFFGVLGLILWIWRHN